HVSEGQQVALGEAIAEMDIAAVAAAGKETSIVVVITNTDQIDAFTLEQTGQQSGKKVVGTIKL
ncbi:PTS glucose transporter subunit IIA, partial [Enterococcus sp.]